MQQAVVLGTGLIGASVAIGLRQAGFQVAAWDPDPDALEAARRLGAFDRGLDAPQVNHADLVVLAGPVPAIVAQLGLLDTEALVTDVAGVKLPVVRAPRRARRFVGGHPMAGRETSGPAGASGSMFRGASWILTTDGAADQDLAAVSEVVRKLGAVPVQMTAAAHDAAVAAVSHLPQVVASVLVQLVDATPAALELAAGGFRDLTRVALSEPQWWADVLVANRAPVAERLRALSSALEEWAQMMEEGDRDGLLQRLSAARSIRAGMAAPVAAVGVVLEDRPGEIARVGHALAESGVDLRDLQLRHATHGGGGVLTLSVRSQELDRLRQALAAEGFTLVHGTR